ncbi:MFS transporter [Clostridium grantii]|uniref:Na+/melibiose symporter n=1 Tax=Clostridium grantii DSM 8605 TaxID=1121316 RepID=A0A1M5UPS1_9CLOT|nr:MFS transporter [Clostridium grantii]SHH64949.1 Na+/melibiose symporter [Clostridium grantii DSM 8605]
MVKKMPVSKKIYYALGQLGWSLAMGLINVWLVWFYFPSNESGITTTFIPQGAVLGVLTIIGIITMIGRFVDAITDPLIATISDRSNNPKGRRIPFMAKASLPLAALTILVFCPPVSKVSSINVLWLFITLILFYVAFTFYVTPYTALISEFGHTPEEKLDLSTYISATWFIGFGIASSASSIWPIFINMGFGMVAAMRITFLILGAVAFVLMMIPALTINEKDYSDSVPSNVPVLESMKATFKNKNFLYFTISDLAYWIAITVYQTGLVYYITVLLKLSPSWTFQMTVLTGIISFLCYPVINILAKKFGKKKMLIFAFVIFTAAYAFTSTLGRLSFNSNIQAYILIILAAIPMAIFGILPNAVIADIADHDAKLTGVRREAMFFGVRTFMSKIGQMLAMLVFTSVLLLGKEVGNDMGIRISAIFSAGVCIIAMVIFLKYNEKEVLNTTKKEK